MTDNKLLVMEIERFAIHDGPGIRSVVFLKGCPLKCSWCANPESQKLKTLLMHNQNKCVKCLKCLDKCDSKALSFNGQINIDYHQCNNCGKCIEECVSDCFSISGHYMSVEDIIQVVKKDNAYYQVDNGGVTISGGELFFQFDMVNKLIDELKHNNYHVTIETSGYVDSDRFRIIVDKVDLVLFDVKHIDSEKFKKMTGGDLSLVADNLNTLVKHYLDKVIIRVPVIPYFNDDKIKDIIEYVSKLRFKEIHLLPFHNLAKNKYQSLGLVYNYGDIECISKSSIEHYKLLEEELGIKIKIGG
ncbi:MAG: glycyl-radical enzyme activating protein [Erysipelotrichaceae bacterium]